MGTIRNNPEVTEHLRQREAIWDTWKHDWDSTDCVEREIGQMTYDIYREYFMRYLGTIGSWDSIPDLLKFVWVCLSVRIFREFGGFTKEDKQLREDRI